MERIINNINQMSGSYHLHDIFQDWVILMAASINNQLIYRKELEDLYLSIIRKYKNEEIEKFFEMTSILVELFEEEISDYLGTIYMKLNAGSSKTGQFFTPFHVCEMMAEISLKDYSGETVTLNEPSCGGSANILAIAKVMKNKGYNYQETLKVLAQDLDYKCVYMSYVQLSMSGINAKVTQGNTLKGDVNIELYTPLYVMKGGWINER